jgi:glycerate kinase
LVGIGGRRHNDAGFGVARAFGLAVFQPPRRRDRAFGANCTTSGKSGRRTTRPYSRNWSWPWTCRIRCSGRRVCTRIYGPQKGVRPEDFEFAERCLGQLATIAQRELHLDFAETPGGGRGGGAWFTDCVASPARGSNRVLICLRAWPRYANAFSAPGS